MNFKCFLFIHLRDGHSKSLEKSMDGIAHPELCSKELKMKEQREIIGLGSLFSFTISSWYMLT